MFPSHVPEEDAKNTETSKRINKSLTSILLLLLIVFLGFLYYWSDPYFWKLLGVLIAIILMLTIKDIKLLEPVIPNRNLRSFVLAAGLGLLPISFGIGKADAQKILDGKSVKAIGTQISKKRILMYSRAKDY
jgi:hypothetical protein